MPGNESPADPARPEGDAPSAPPGNQSAATERRPPGPALNEFLRFAPLVQERVWGGRALEDVLGRAGCPSGRPIGESWEIVDRPEAQSVIVGGSLAGLTLHEALAQPWRRHHGSALAGRKAVSHARQMARTVASA